MSARCGGRMVRLGFEGYPNAGARNTEMQTWEDWGSQDASYWRISRSSGNASVTASLMSVT